MSIYSVVCVARIFYHPYQQYENIFIKNPLKITYLPTKESSITFGDAAFFVLTLTI